MKYELLAFSATSGDAFIKQNDDTYFISYPYEKEDLVLVTESSIMESHNLMSKHYNQIFDSLTRLGNFLGKLYIDDIKNSPKLVQNRALLEKIEKEQEIEIGTNPDFSIVLVGAKSHQKHNTLSPIYKLKTIYTKAHC